MAEYPPAFGSMTVNIEAQTETAPRRLQDEMPCRLLILGSGPVLSLADVSWLFDELQPLTESRKVAPRRATIDAGETSAPAAPAPSAESPNGLGGIPLEEIERQAILDTLRQTCGNQTRAAKVLGISDRTLREKIRRYRRQDSAEGLEVVDRVRRPLVPVS